MTLPYTLRLLCLCFASFFLVQAALGLVAWIATPGATQIGESMRPRSGARFLLALRLLPVTLAALTVAGFCIPSYLWLETNEATERVGLACCAAALLGAIVCASSLIRSARALWLSAHSMQHRRVGCTSHANHSLPMTLVDSDAPVLALGGMLRPRIIVTRSVLQTLSPEELEAALAHEQAHYTSADNWKRLALFLAPDIFPFSRAFVRLNRSWAKLIEWAADDDAAAGDPRRSVSLAAALVQIARLGSGSAASPLASSLLKNDNELPVRVNRLLGLAPATERSSHGAQIALGTVVVLITTLVVAAIIRPETLLSVHRLLEQFIR